MWRVDTSTHTYCICIEKEDLFDILQGNKNSFACFTQDNGKILFLRIGLIQSIREIK